MSGHTAIILFTRWPLPGRAKTRLIPALGPEGAAAFHRRMTEHTVGRAWAFAATAQDVRVTIAYEGGEAAAMRDWLGPLHCLPQGGGDLGQRLTTAAGQAFEDGAARVVVIGTDCPSLDESILTAAVAALREAGIVFGPAGDGGYYLAGVSERRHLVIFENIPWSTAEVLSASLAAARALNCEPAQLATLSDVDEPSDLPAAEAALAAADRVSIIIPALNEAANLKRLLPTLQTAGAHEILIADGGSTDETAAAASAHGARCLSTPPGRAVQMNAAARAASGEYLLFLHADTDPPPDGVKVVRRTLRPAGVAAGAFTFRLREPVRFQRLIEGGVAFRCRTRSLPFGDQGLFVRRSVFTALEGFPEWPILEDVELIRRLRRSGRIVIAPEPAFTSSRRWQQRGVIRTFLRHQLILTGHALGISPERLARWVRR